LKIGNSKFRLPRSLIANPNADEREFRESRLEV
jgi:hypothetical protein